MRSAAMSRFDILILMIALLWVMVTVELILEDE